MERSLPMVWILIPWLAGNRAAAAGLVPGADESILPLVLLVGTGSYALLAYRQRWRRNRKWRFVPGLMAACLLFGFGFGVHRQHAIDTLKPDVYTAPAWCSLKLRTSPTEGKQGRWRVAAKVQSQRHKPDHSHDAWLLRGRDSSTLQAGQTIIAWMAPRAPALPDGPWDFDAPAWLRGMGLSAEGRLESGFWKALPPNATIRSRLDKQRQAAVDAFQRIMPKAHQAAMLEAMALGFRENLAAETKASFSASGTMHVLAVSGLHVGILAGWLRALLALLGRILPLALWPMWQRYQGMMSIPLIVAYALFAGASPSVLRASLLFAFWAIGRAHRSSPSAWNAWAACLFVMTCLQPSLLASVGACLSFSAVAGIIGLYRPLRESLTWGGRLGAFWADLVAMSIAAQAGSLPVAWMTFGQVPLWFLLGNALALPAASLLLPSAGVVLLLSPFPGLAAYGAIPIAWGIDAWLWATGLLAGFPQARMPPLPAWSAYAMLLALSWWILLQGRQAAARQSHQTFPRRYFGLPILLVLTALGGAYREHAQRQQHPIALIQSVRGSSRVFVAWRGHALGFDKSPALQWSLQNEPIPDALPWFGVHGALPLLGQGAAFPLLPPLAKAYGADTGALGKDQACFLEPVEHVQSGKFHSGNTMIYVEQGSPPAADIMIADAFKERQSDPVRGSPTGAVILGPGVKRADRERWQLWCNALSIPCRPLPWSGSMVLEIWHPSR